MDTLWIPYGYPMDTPWIPYGYPMDTLWIPYGNPMDSLWIPYGYTMDIPSEIGPRGLEKPLNKPTLGLPKCSILEPLAPPGDHKKQVLHKGGPISHIWTSNWEPFWSHLGAMWPTLPLKSKAVKPVRFR